MAGQSEAPWRAWYRTPEWRALKKFVHERDGYTCQRNGCGRKCVGKFPANDSPVADHKVPHRGDKAKFFDPSNLQTLCKSPCHDKLKQVAEQGSRQELGVWY